VIFARKIFFKSPFSFSAFSFVALRIIGVIIFGLSFLFLAIPIMTIPLITTAPPLLPGAEAQEPDAGTEDIFSYGAGVRAWGMGGAFTAISDDASGGSWNPAGLVNVPRKEVSLLHVGLFEDTVYQYIGYAHPILDVGTLGIGITRLGTEGIPLYSERADYLGTISNMQGQAMFSFASWLPWSLWGSLAAGGNVKLVMHELAGYSASGFGLDLGLLYQPRFARNLYLGVNAQNLVAPRLKLSLEEDVLPLNLRVGLAYKWRMGPQSQIILALGADQSADSSTRTHLGMEFSYRNLFAARLGMGEGKFSGGAGFGYGDFWFDYALSTADLGSVHKFSLTYRFGRTMAEEREMRSRRLKEEVERKVEEGVKSLLKEQINAGVEEQMRVITENKVNEFYQQGLNYLQQGEYSLAIESFQKVLAWSAEHPEVQASLKKATEDLMKATVKTRLDEGKNLYEKGQSEEAIFKWKEVLEIEPQHREAQELIARARAEITRQEIELIFSEAMELFNQKDFLGAEAKFRRVMDLAPEHSLASDYLQQIEEIRRQEKIATLYAEGMNLYQEKKYEEAGFKFRNLLDISPGNIKAQEGLMMAQQAMETERLNRLLGKLMEEGLTHYQSGNWLKAEQAFQQILTLKPDHAEAQNYQEQIRIRLHNEKIKQLLSEAKIFYQEEKLEDARVKFHQVLELDPAQEEAKQYLQKVEESERLRRHQELVARFYEEGEALYNRGEYELAQIKYRQVLDLESSHAGAQARLAELLLRQVELLLRQGEEYLAAGRSGEAEVRFREVLEMMPDEVRAQEYLQKIEESERLRRHQELVVRFYEEGEALYNRGEYELAQIKYRQVLDLESGHTGAQARLVEVQRELLLRQVELLLKDGISYYQNGKKEEAEVKFHNVLELNPENVEAKGYLQKIGQERKQQQLMRNLEEGKDYYQKNQYQEAIFKFRQVLDLDPGNKEAQSYLQSAQKTSQQEEWQRLSENYYKEGLQLYESNRLEEARIKFRQALDLTPEYSPAAEFLQKINEKEKLLRIDYLLVQAKDFFQKGLYEDARLKIKTLLEEESQHLEAQQLLQKIDEVHRQIRLQETILQLYEQGENFYRQGQLEEAEYRFRQVLDLDPNHGGAGKYLPVIREELAHRQREESIKGLLEEGQRLYQEGRYDEVLLRVRQIKDLDPQYEGARDLEGRTLQAQREKERERLRLEREESIKNLFTEGEEFYHKENYENAIIRFQQVLDLDPQHPQAEQYLQMARRARQEQQTRIWAQEIFQEGISLFERGNFSESVVKLSQVLDLVPEYPQAEEYREKAQRSLWQQKIESLQKEGEEFYRNKDWVNAIIKFEQIMDLDSSHRQAQEYLSEIQRNLKVSDRLQLGISYFSGDDPSRAIRELEQVLRIFPGHPVAEDYLNRSRRRLKELIDDYQARAVLYQREGRLVEALEQWNEILKLDPGRRDIQELTATTRKQLQKSWHYMRGLEYYEQKKYREAIMEFQSVLNLDPGYQKAGEYLRLATVQLSPEQKFPSEEVLRLYYQGMEYYLNEEFEKAIAVWEELLKLDPYNQNAIRNIEDARRKLEKIKSQKR